MSETGGAQLTVPEGCMDDILGYPNRKESFLVQDENDGKYYLVDDGVRTGVLYVASDSLCMNELDGEVLFEYTKIEGRDFICTNDLVRVNPDGSFSYAGRADRFFVNNDGVRFEAGAVETEISKQPGIGKCAVVPVLDKRIHDTVPALYIVPEKKGGGAAERVRRALVNAYIAGGTLDTDILPSQFILVDDIPCNANGKIDIYKITRDRLRGEAWNIIPVREAGRLTDILAEPAGQADSITGGTLPEGMEGRSALGIYELFNTQPEQKRKGSRPSPFGLGRSMRAKHRSMLKKKIF
jgi:acyl-CoA synthetase (AMP-forming)/AMP-acid ligase II